MKGSYLNDGFFGRLETLSLYMRRNLLGFFGGKHLVSTYGQTVEFADYREYMPGDDIRRIDWNLYSRFEKHFLKLFTDERQMHVQIFLDCSASMGRDRPEKANYAIALAAAMGFLAVHNMDKVSFHLVKGKHAEDPFGTIVGKSAFFGAISQLENVSFEGEADLSAAVAGVHNTGNNDGLTVIISDFLTENDWRRGVDYLSYKKRQILLLQLLTPEELEPLYEGRCELIDTEAESMYDGKNMKLRITRGMQEAYAMALADYRAELKDFCLSRGAGFLSLSTDRPIEKAIFSDLMKAEVIA